MTKEQAEFIKEAFDQAGEECSVRSDYSGRGMWGETTYGVTVDNPQSIFTYCMAYIKENLSFDCDDLEELEQKIPDFDILNLDSMGMSYIVY